MFRTSESTEYRHGSLFSGNFTVEILGCPRPQSKTRTVSRRRNPLGSRLYRPSTCLTGTTVPTFNLESGRRIRGRGVPSGSGTTTTHGLEVVTSGSDCGGDRGKGSQVSL